MLCGLLLLGACQKIEIREEHSEDEALTGVVVNVPSPLTTSRKLFVLNEGSMGSNNATLDFLRLQEGLYISSAFKKMNPSVGAGLGDVGNDIVVIDNEVWIVVNNSGIVEVISAIDEKEIKAISIPTPRYIAYDSKYVYVTSYAGAFITYDGWTVVDSSNPKGQVYRINRETKQVEGNVEVGYQPEGIAYYNGNLYVANSGGLASQLPPYYSYDNTVSIIDAASFTVSKTVEVQINLKNVYSDGKGNIYVTTLGNYWDVPSGLYMIKASAPGSPVHVSDYVTASALYKDEGAIYCVGTENEFDYSADHVYSAWVAKDGKKTPLALSLNHAYPYSLGVLDGNTIFVGELAVSSYTDENGDQKWSTDYFNPGVLTCYVRGNKFWSVQAGAMPGHFAVY